MGLNVVEELGITVVSYFHCVGHFFGVSSGYWYLLHELVGLKG